MGRGRHRVDLNHLTGLISGTNEGLLGFDDALHCLATDYSAAAELVNLQFFAGMTVGLATKILSMADRTADYHWVFARTWLADALARE